MQSYKKVGPGFLLLKLKTTLARVVFYFYFCNMKKSEFEEIKKKFEAENKRWEKLKVGQSVYESVARWFDMEYFEIIIDEINVDERYIVGRDQSQGGKKVTLSGFDTVEELKERGITFKDKS